MSINIKELKKENKELSNLCGQIGKTSYVKNRYYNAEMEFQISYNELLIRLQEEWNKKVGKNIPLYFNKNILAFFDETGIHFGFSTEASEEFYKYVHQSDDDNARFIDELALKMVRPLHFSIDYVNYILTRMKTVNIWRREDELVPDEELVERFVTTVDILQSDRVHYIMSTLSAYVDVLITSNKN